MIATATLAPATFLLELTARPQWVVHRDKIPHSPRTGERASSTDPATWASFAEACAARERFDGLGFVFTPDDPFVGVDLDKCRDRDTGAIEPWALAIIARLNSYTEVSPSGTGVHILVRGTLPPGGRRRGRVEMYDSGRYFTMTGDRLASTPATIEERSAELTELHAELFPPASAPQTCTPDRQGQPARLDVSDEELIAKASAARNGAKFAALWSGDTSAYGGDHSATDQALVNMLVWWADGDGERADRLFRRSGLMRNKWDERHYSDGTTYGAATIAKAVAGYTPPMRRDGPPDAALELPAVIEDAPAETVIADLRTRLALAERRAAQLEGERATAEWNAAAERRSRMQLLEIAGHPVMDPAAKIVMMLALPDVARAPATEQERDGEYRVVFMNVLRKKSGGQIAEDGKWVGGIAQSTARAKFEKYGPMAGWDVRTEHNAREGRNEVRVHTPHVGSWNALVGDLLDIQPVGTAEEQRLARPGGDPRKRPQCSTCGPTEAIIEHTTWICAGCGDVLSEHERRIEPDADPMTLPAILAGSPHDASAEPADAVAAVTEALASMLATSPDPSDPTRQNGGIGMSTPPTPAILAGSPPAVDTTRAPTSPTRRAYRDPTDDQRAAGVRHCLVEGCGRRTIGHEWCSTHDPSGFTANGAPVRLPVPPAAAEETAGPSPLWDDWLDGEGERWVS